MDIILYPNEILRTKCESIKATDSGVLKKLNEMKRWIQDPANKAYGLALPQIGIAKQGFVFYNLLTENHEVVINPRILRRSGTQPSEEGCLSIPGNSATITRAKEIEVMYFGFNMKPKKTVLRNRTACIFQHEYDHLQGKLYVDYIGEG